MSLIAFKIASKLEEKYKISKPVTSHLITSKQARIQNINKFSLKYK